jgi:hypothetical protein
MHSSENPLVVFGASRSITIDAAYRQTDFGPLAAPPGCPIRLSTHTPSFAVRSCPIGKSAGAAFGFLARNPPGVGAPDSLPTHYLIAVGDPPCSVRPIAQLFCP